MKSPTVKLPAKALRPRMVRSTFGPPYIEGFTRPEKEEEETRADIYHALAALYEDRVKYDEAIAVLEEALK